MKMFWEIIILLTIIVYSTETEDLKNSKFNTESEVKDILMPSIRLPNRLGKREEHSVRLPNRLGKRGEHSVRLPNRLGKREEHSVFLPNRFGEREEHSVRLPNRLGERGKLSFRLPNRFGKREEHSVRLPNRFGKREDKQLSLKSFDNHKEVMNRTLNHSKKKTRHAKYFKTKYVFYFAFKDNTFKNPINSYFKNLKNH
jgi:hypothetical protein